MKVVSIFVYLCFFLLSGGKNAHAVNQSKGFCKETGQNMEASLQGVSIASIQGCHYYTLNKVRQENNYLGSNDVEAEDNNYAERKVRVPADYSSPEYSYRVLHEQINQVKTSPFFTSPAGCKYILLRVLRV